MDVSHCTDGRYLDAFAGIATVCCMRPQPPRNPRRDHRADQEASALHHALSQPRHRRFRRGVGRQATRRPQGTRQRHTGVLCAGTEANELAILTARLYTGSHNIISLRNSYHGNAAGIMGKLFSGYMAPEYAMEGIFSTKSNVYSSGVLILELITDTRRSSIDHIMNFPNLIVYVSAWNM
ncbi:hypothetical protein PR202_gb19810 [Eleusine coracana subsp. coracana]|uniref:Uncharacterized protein n=1 Tax=Eleusine coracana subsp. coracana TaxID=191504 RepID=A0AAV5F924_ELECO|nr:hypothetical protein PR202_gb19810 [Eleusine coracana subsp. coracana]